MAAPPASPPELEQHHAQHPVDRSGDGVRLGPAESGEEFAGHGVSLLAKAGGDSFGGFSQRFPDDLPASLIQTHADSLAEFCWAAQRVHQGLPKLPSGFCRRFFS